MFKYILCLCLALALPVQAKIVAKATGAEGSLLLSDDKCEGSSYFKMEARNPDQKVVFTGCWLVHKSTVVILWDDGDVNALNFTVFDWNPSI